MVYTTRVHNNIIIYTVSDKRKVNIQKIRNFPGCGSHFNMYQHRMQIEGGWVVWDKP